MRSDLGRVFASINLATTFPDEPWEAPGVNVQRAGGLGDYAREFYLYVTEPDTLAYHSQEERTADALSILSEARDAIEALSLNLPSQETLKELVELRDKADAVISRLCAPPAQEAHS